MNLKIASLSSGTIRLTATCGSTGAIVGVYGLLIQRFGRTVSLLPDIGNVIR